MSALTVLRNSVLSSVIAASLCSVTPVQAAAPASAVQTSAAQRFKALYTREWRWRQAQLAGAVDEDNQATQSGPADHLPKVDVATQQMRTAYWQQVLLSLIHI